MNDAATDLLIWNNHKRYTFLRSLYVGINGAQSDNDLLTGDALDKAVDALIEEDARS